MDQSTPHISLARIQTTAATDDKVGSSTLSTQERRAHREARTKDKKQKISKKIHEMIHEIELLLNLSPEQMDEDQLYEFAIKFNGIIREKLSSGSSQLS